MTPRRKAAMKRPPKRVARTALIILQWAEAGIGDGSEVDGLEAEIREAIEWFIAAKPRAKARRR